MSGRCLWVALSLLGLFLAHGSAVAFDSEPSNFAERLRGMDFAVMIKVVSTTEPKPGGAGKQPVLEVVDIAKQPAAEIKLGQVITLPFGVRGEPGDLMLLLGFIETKPNWVHPTPITREAFDYIKQTPAPPDDSTPVAFYIEHLESPDKLIAADAYDALNQVTQSDLMKFRGEVQHAEARRWIEASEQNPQRHSLYGFLLGLSGTPDDRDFLEKQALAPSEVFRPGLDGLMLGYLMLAGEDGLLKLEDAKLRDHKVILSEAYAAMQAIQELWNNGEGIISKPRLCESTRLLLGRTDLADVAVVILARFQDWEAMEQVVGLYDAPASDNAKPTKRAVLRYLLRLTEKLADSTEPGQVDLRTRATAFLDEKKVADPETYEQVMKFQLLVKPVRPKPKAMP